MSARFVATAEGWHRGRKGKLYLTVVDTTSGGVAFVMARSNAGYVYAQYNGTRYRAPTSAQLIALIANTDSKEITQ